MLKQILILFILAFLFSGCIFEDCVKSSNQIKTHIKEITANQTQLIVETKGKVKLIINQSDDPTLIYQGDEQIYKTIDIFLSEDKIYIKSNKCFDSKEPVVFYLSMNTINNIQIKGSNTLIISNLSSQTTNIILDGTNNALIQTTSELMNLKTFGMSNVKLIGTLENLNIDSTGSTSIFANSLILNYSTIRNKGSLTADLNIFNSLSIDNTGSAIIFYLNNPRIEKQGQGLVLVSQNA